MLLPEARLFLLGAPHAEYQGQTIKLTHRKPLALLAYLAIERRLHTRESLAALLWPDQDASRAYAYLRNALWQLSRLPLAPWLIVEQDTVALDATLWCDVAAFETLTTTSLAHQHPDAALCDDCAAGLTQAVELYRGNFLEGFILDDCADFESWIFLHAEHLRQRIAVALERLTHHYGACGDAEAALRAGQRWVTLDPLNEPAQRTLMLIYAQAGQRSAALQQYDSLLRHLRGARLEPAVETVELYKRIRTGSIVETRPEMPEAILHPPTAPARRNNLPAQTTSFFGRETELAEIHRLLALDDCRLITITGPGGIGKSRLAIQVAQEQVERFDDGVVMVSLASVRRPELIVASFSDALAITFYPQSDLSPRDQLLAYLRDKHLLLLVDNVEHLMESAALLSDIAATASRVKLLVTSRERLNVRGEWIIQLQGLSYPQDGVNEIQIRSSDAVQLFLASAQRLTRDFAPDATELQAITDICRLVDGMPLGIELAATWTKMLSCTEIAEEVATSLDFLSLTLRDLPERHQSLRAVFARSWGLLTTEERQTFQSLTVFEQGFTREAATAVAQAGLPALMALTDKSMLRRTSEGRYEILEVLRQYATEQLRAVPGAWEAARARHSHYYLDLLHRLERPLKGDRQRGWRPPVSQQTALEMIHRDIANIRRAWQWAAEQSWREEIENAAVALALFYDIRSRYREGVAMFEEAATALQESLEQPAPALIGLLRGLQGEFLGRLSLGAESNAAVDEALALAHAVAPSTQLAVINLVAAYPGRGTTAAERKALAQEALELFTAADDTWGVALAHEVLAEVALQSGDYAQATDHLQQGLALRRELNDLWGKAIALFSLGDLLYAQGKAEDARAYYEESLSLRESLDDRRGVALCQHVLGRVSHNLGDLAQACELQRQSIQGFKDVGDIGGAASSTSALAFFMWQAGNADRATELFTTAIEQLRAIGDRQVLAFTLWNFGKMLCDQDRPAEAESYLEQSLALCTDLGLEWMVTIVTQDLQIARQSAA